MSSGSKFPKTKIMNVSAKGSRRNYWSPLQCLPDSDTDNENDVEKMDDSASPSNSNKKVQIPPIKLLQKSCEYVHTTLKSLNILDYSIKKMSIGIKIMCESMNSYNLVLGKLIADNCQYFTHALKSEKAFKVILYGLSEINTTELKNELIKLGLLCKEVKMITKKYEQYTDTFYIVSLENGSIKLFQLKKSYRSIFHTQINWSYQRKQKNRLTQCRNCQMFGHGESNCHVKTYCSICAGPHKTDECNNTEVYKCANCNEQHKSTDSACAIRKRYLEMREKLSNKASHRIQAQPKITNNAVNISMQKLSPSYQSLNDFPIMTNRVRERQGQSMKPTTWQRTTPVVNTNPVVDTHLAEAYLNRPTPSTGELFSMDELNTLVMEMITKLSLCKTKLEQFQAIAQLATKFLYSNVK